MQIFSFFSQTILTSLLSTDLVQDFLGENKHIGRSILLGIGVTAGIGATYFSGSFLVAILSFLGTSFITSSVSGYMQDISNAIKDFVEDTLDGSSIEPYTRLITPLCNLIPAIGLFAFSAFEATNGLLNKLLPIFIDSTSSSVHQRSDKGYEQSFFGKYISDNFIGSTLAHIEFMGVLQTGVDFIGGIINFFMAKDTALGLTVINIKEILKMQQTIFAPEVVIDNKEIRDTATHIFKQFAQCETFYNKHLSFQPMIDVVCNIFSKISLPAFEVQYSSIKDTAFYDKALLLTQVNIKARIINQLEESFEIRKAIKQFEEYGIKLNTFEQKEINKHVQQQVNMQLKQLADYDFTTEDIKTYQIFNNFIIKKSYEYQVYIQKAEELQAQEDNLDLDYSILMHA